MQKLQVSGYLQTELPLLLEGKRESSPVGFLGSEDPWDVYSLHPHKGCAVEINSFLFCISSRAYQALQDNPGQKAPKETEERE